MLYLINRSSIRHPVHPDIDHIKNPFNKLLHHNKSYFQLNHHRPDIPASKVHRQTSLVNHNIFQFLQEDHHAIQHKVKAITATQIVVVVAMFQFHTHQVEVVLDISLKIQHHLKEEVTEAMQDLVEEFLQMV